MEVAPNGGKRLSNFKRGLMLGFASPLLFLGPLPRLQVEPKDNVAEAWRNVGNALRTAMARQSVQPRDEERE